MSLMMRYLIRNRYRYFRHFLKTFAPVFLIIAVVLGGFIYTNGPAKLSILLSIFPDDYSIYIFAILSLVTITLSLFSIKSGVYIYHATIHYFYNTNYLLQLLFCMYLKKLVGCLIGASIISFLISNSLGKYTVTCMSITTYMFLIGMLRWVKFNSKDRTKWVIISFMLSGLFVYLRENFFGIGIIGSIATLACVKHLHIDYSKWMEECSFVDEAAFASAKQDMARMYHVQSIAKARNFHKFSYPIWSLNIYNNLVQKTIIKMIREPKRMWIIWAMPFIGSIALKFLWSDFVYSNIVMTIAVCFFLSGMNQYLYNDFFELLNKAKKGLFLPYSTTLMIVQGMVVPTVVFFAIAIIVWVFAKVSIEETFLLFACWILSYLLLILYRIFRGNPNRIIIALQSAAIFSMTFGVMV